MMDHIFVRLALQMMSLVFVRTGELISGAVV